MSDPVIATNLDTPLMLAARNGELETLQSLIASGVAIDDRDEDGRTAFIHASISGEFDTAKALLAAGADINAVDNFGNSAIHYCIVGRSVGRSKRFLSQLLIKNGANLKAEDATGYTPLMLASKSGYFKLVENGRPDLVKILIIAGVDVNFRNSNKQTALSVAAKDGNFEIFEMLVKLGAYDKYYSSDAYERQILIDSIPESVRDMFAKYATAHSESTALRKNNANEDLKIEFDPQRKPNQRNRIRL